MGFKKQTGNSLTRQCLEYLKLKGIYAWRQSTVGVWDAAKQVYRKPKVSTRGVSDILGVLPGGTFLAVEVKAGKDTLSPEQGAFIDNVNRQGGLAFVVRDLDTLIATIEKALET